MSDHERPVEAALREKVTALHGLCEEAVAELRGCFPTDEQELASSYWLDKALVAKQIIENADHRAALAPESARTPTNQQPQNPKGRSQVKKKSAQFVLVRTYAAGVHVGTLVSKSGKEVVLKNARRVWRWRGANTLHELSQKGGDDSWTRISEAVPEIILLDAIEIIPCSSAGSKNLERARWPA